MIVLRFAKWLFFIVIVGAVFYGVVYIIYKSATTKPQLPLEHPHRTPAEIGEDVGHTGTQFSKGMLKGIREEISTKR